jgi:CheY-like chemotaxis protein
MTLPSCEPAPRDEAPPAKRESVPVPAAQQSPLRIVLVEDNADIRDMMETLLVAHGHDVASTEDGEQGAALVISTAPDVALVDIGLPKLDGYAVATRIREELGSSVRLVAMTGYGQDTDRERALAAGFDVHVVKPVSSEALKKILSQVPRRPTHGQGGTNGTSEVSDGTGSSGQQPQESRQQEEHERQRPHDQG